MPSCTFKHMHKWKLVHKRAHGATLTKILNTFPHRHTFTHAAKVSYAQIYTSLDTLSDIPQLSASITHLPSAFTVPLTCLCISRLLRGKAAPHLTSQHPSFKLNRTYRLSKRSIQKAPRSERCCPFRKLKENKEEEKNAP